MSEDVSLAESTDAGPGLPPVSSTAAAAIDLTDGGPKTGAASGTSLDSQSQDPPAQSHSESPGPGRKMVDVRGTRFSATVTCVLFAVVFLTLPDNRLQESIVPVVLLTFQTAVFGAAAIFGLQAQLYGRIFKAFVAPRLGPATDMEDAAPPRFAQQVGLGFALVALIALALGFPILAKAAVGMAFAAAFLNAVFNFCLGCEVYLAWKRIASRRHRSVSGERAPAGVEPGAAEAREGEAEPEDVVDTAQGAGDEEPVANASVTDASAGTAASVAGAKNS